jgi:hypothetical protein
MLDSLLTSEDYLCRRMMIIKSQNSRKYQKALKSSSKRKRAVLRLKRNLRVKNLKVHRKKNNLRRKRNKYPKKKTPQARIVRLPKIRLRMMIPLILKML